MKKNKKGIVNSNPHLTLSSIGTSPSCCNIKQIVVPKTNSIGMIIYKILFFQFFIIHKPTTPIKKAPKAYVIAKGE
jgi:hypothetical protein